MKLSRRTFTKLVAAAPFFTGTSLATAATPSGTVIIARNLDSTRTLDPHEVYEIAPSEFIRSMYSRIVDLDNETFSKVVPGVAKSWEASDNGRTYTFTIDTNQKFHSGRNVTAEDVAWSLRRAATLGRRVSFMIAQFGLNKDTAEKNIRAEGDKVIVTLDKSYAPNLFLNVLTTTNGAVVDKDLVLRHEKDGDLGNGWLRTNAAGGGAYMLQSYTPKEAAVLKANPDFYLGAPKTDTIIVRNVNEPGSQLLLLEKGDIDIAQDLTADQISGLEGNKDVKVTSIPVGTVFYLALNLSHPALSKPAVWEALRYLVDYDALCNNLFEGTYSVAQSFLAPGVNGSIGTQPYHFDPEKAKALLAEAGYPDGFELSMDVRPSDPYQATAQAIQATFAQAGIKLALNVSEAVSYMTKIRKGDFEFMMYSKTLDYNDPNAMTSYFAVNDETTPKAPEWTHWKVPEEMAKKTEEAAAEQDPQKRDDLYKEIQEEIQRKSPFIFMFRQLTRVSMRANVSGFRAGSPFDSGIYYLIEKSAS